MNSIKIIDTTKNNFNDTDFLQVFQNIFKENFVDFAYKLDLISENFSKNLYWWISLTASRNSLKSSIYREFCIILSIKKFHQQNKCDYKYIVSSSYLKEAILASLPKDFPEVVVKKKTFFSSKKFRDYVRPIYYFLNKLIQILFIKVIFSKIKTDKHIILVESFISPNEDFNRYYPDFDKFLEPSIDQSIFFVPTVINTRIFNIFSVIKKIISSEKRFFLRESFLNVYDLIQAVNYKRKLKKIDSQLKLNVYDQSMNGLKILVSGSLISEPFNGLSAEGILNYNFIKHLNSLKYNNIKSFINWWENTPMDKGLNIALNSFFPNLISTGYMGFVPNQYSFELSPSNQELTSEVLPNSIGVIGKAYLPILNRCCNDIVGFEAPAFRFAYLKNVIDGNKKHILVLPSIDREEWIKIQDIIYSLADTFSEKKFIIKPHPGMGEFQKNEDVPNVEINHNSDVEKLMRDAEALITSTSSAAMEAIVRSLPTFIYNSEDTIPKNIIPSCVDRSFWRGFKNKDELFREFKNILEMPPSGTSIKNVIKLSRYFNLPNKENVLFFFSKI